MARSRARTTETKTTRSARSARTPATAAPAAAAPRRVVTETEVEVVTTEGERGGLEGGIALVTSLLLLVAIVLVMMEMGKYGSGPLA